MNENEKTRVAEVRSVEARQHKKHFSVLDFGLVVIILLAVLGIGFRTVIAEWIVRSAPEETIKIAFKAEGVTPEQLAQMKENDVLTFDEEFFAILTAYRSETGNTVVEQKKADGSITFVSAEDQSHYTVFCEAEVNGNYTDSGFVCRDDMNLYVGKILNIDSSSYSITVIITEIPRK